MSVDVLNITLSDVKLAAVDMHNQINGRSDNIPVDHVTVTKAPIEDALYMNTGSRGVGVIMDKILLQDILPSVVDLRPFKIPTVSVGKEFGPEDVDGFNNRYNAEMLAVEKDILKSATNFDIELLKNWVLFCRVLGFFELDVGDVSLFMAEGKMYVSVNPTNAIYSGYVEVLV